MTQEQEKEDVKELEQCTGCGCDLLHGKVKGKGQEVFCSWSCRKEYYED